MLPKEEDSSNRAEKVRRIRCGKRYRLSVTIVNRLMEEDLGLEGDVIGLASDWDWW